MHKDLLKKSPWLLLGQTLCLTVATLTAKPVDLTTADLGRHIANGRWVFSHPELLFTNFYSYTHPGAPFTNHHWLTGLIFHAIETSAGFSGLSVFYVTLVVAAFALMLMSAWQRSAPPVALALGLLVAPLVSYRTEVRPEGVSLFLAVIVYALINAFAEQKLSWKWLLTVPVIMVLWVNSHIYFFFGLLIIGIFLAEGALKAWLLPHGSARKNHTQRCYTLLAILTLSALASLINPEGWKLATYPLKIFDNYGYMIVENQSVPFFLDRHMHFPVFTPLYITLAGVWGLAVWGGVRNRIENLPLASIFIALLLSALALKAIRNISMFGVFALPVMAQLLPEPPKRFGKSLLLCLVASCSTAVYFATSSSATFANLGVGLRNGCNEAADFFRSKNLKGPVFNNYDIGGYLIYHLYPATKVFVDNRPEAYPASFLTDVYVPMQENDTKWREIDANQHFNAIFFNWHDYTPAGQTFLITRIRDPEWAPVYVDQFALIFLRRTTENQPIISRYEIPKDRFSVR